MTVIAKEHATVELQQGPIEVRARSTEGWNVSWERWPPGDYRPLFKGLPGDSCLARHFGYCLRGKGEAIYADRVERIEAGQAYVLAPGHTFRVIETFETVEFTELTAEYAEVGQVFVKNFPAWFEAHRDRLAKTT